MRTSELLLILSALPITVALFGGSVPRTKSFRFAYLLPCIAIAWQLYSIGLYWQIAPALLAYLLLIVTAVFFAQLRQWKIRLLAICSLLLLICSVTFLTILPTFRLPAPTGEFAVGTRIMHLVDGARSDHAFASGHRELMIQLWYPTDTQNGALARYRRRTETTLLSSYMALMKTHSFLDASIAKGSAPHPLLIFNPAWGGQRTQNTYLVEELASHGYIVVAIDHTHNSIPISFPDGLLLNLTDPQGVRDPSTGPLADQIAYYETELRRQSDDDIFVLDSILKENALPASPLFQTIDQHRIAVLGHSFGGAVSVETAFRDSRIRGALNLDGWNFGELGRSAFKKPLMLMYEDSAPELQAFRVPHPRGIVTIPLDAWDSANVQRTLSEYGGYMLVIRGAGHFNYGDRALYSPISKLAEAGHVKPELVHVIVRRYTLAFFSEMLDGKWEPLLHQSGSPYPEVTFEAFRPPQP